jgi:hypothetical protein
MVASSSHADMPEQNSVNLAIAAGHNFSIQPPSLVGTWHLFSVSRRKRVSIYLVCLCVLT